MIARLVEGHLDAPAAEGAPKAANRILDPLHGNAVPDSRGRRDGLLLELRRVAAPGDGRPVVLPEALRDLRGHRPRGDAPALAAGPQSAEERDAAPARRLVRPVHSGNAAGHRRDGE